jgi:outer membrane protein assembly factor BamA
VTRIEGAVSISRRENPHYEIGDTRREASVRAERTITPWLRAGGGARLAGVEFGDSDETFLAPTADLILDTRLDPAFPRNAVYALGAVEQLRFDHDRDVVRWTADLRGYVGLMGSSVLALRALNIRANGPVPAYEQSLLGGDTTLRGFDFGYRVGDNLASMSAELRVPITSPISVGRFGVKGFLDAGAAYPHGAAVTDQTFERGAGAGVFMSWAVLRMGLDVAWPVSGSSHKPQWHFGMGVAF